MKLICPTFSRPDLVVSMSIVILRNHEALSHNRIYTYHSYEWLFECFVDVTYFPVGRKNRRLTIGAITAEHHCLHICDDRVGCRVTVKNKPKDPTRCESIIRRAEHIIPI